VAIATQRAMSKTESENNQVEEILKMIINKGGLMGAVAKMYINDKEKAKQFIAECFEQCHNRSAQIHWGEDLVKDIINYSCDQLKS
jgi:hypothetical protein